MDIMLHLGAHRCASTTLQSYMWSNRRAMAKQGLTGWTPRRTRDGLLRGLVRHPKRITVDDERLAIRSVGRLRVEFARLQNLGQKGLLISDENIMGSMRSNVAERGLYRLLEERLKRLQPVFEGRRLTVGLSVRSYENYWASCLASLMSRGGAVPNVDLLDMLTTQPRRWRTLVRDIAAAFPEAEIVVWPFERMASQPDAQLAALWPHDIDLPAASEIWQNRGSDLHRLNGLMAMRGERLVVDGPLQVGTSWMPFDQDQCAVLRAEYRSDLAWLAGGADGLARFVDGRKSPSGPVPDMATGTTMMAKTGSGGSTPAPNMMTNTGTGRLTSGPRPDRAELTCAADIDAVLFGGRHDGIEKGQRESGLGRTGAS